MAIGRNNLLFSSAEQSGGTSLWLKNAPFLHQHVVEGLWDIVQDANQLGQHPLGLQRVQLNSPSNRWAGLSSLLASLALTEPPQQTESGRIPAVLSYSQLKTCEICWDSAVKGEYLTPTQNMLSNQCHAEQVAHSPTLCLLTSQTTVVT